jgi:hypothetical protein
MHTQLTNNRYLVMRRLFEFRTGVELFPHTNRHLNVRDRIDPSLSLSDLGYYTIQSVRYIECCAMGDCDSCTGSTHVHVLV